MKDTAASIEYFTPTLGLQLEPYLARELKQGIHHLGRYHWARSVLVQREPRRILDIACGSGYGSFLLASALPEAVVVGADYDARAIDLARTTYAADNLQYLMADMTRWTTGEKALGTFDALFHSTRSSTSCTARLHCSGSARTFPTTVVYSCPRHAGMP